MSSSNTARFFLAASIPLLIGMLPFLPDSLVRSPCRIIRVPLELALTSTLCASLIWLAGLRPTGHRLTYLWHGVVFCAWFWFWIEDLHRAEFQWILLLLPVGMSVGVLFGKSRYYGFLGELAAWSVIWLFMVARSDNGCTGVSSIFKDTLFITTLAIFLGGPFVAIAETFPVSGSKSSPS